MAFKLHYAPWRYTSSDTIEEVNAHRMPAAPAAGLQPPYLGVDRGSLDAWVTTSWSPASAGFGAIVGKVEARKLEVCQTAQARFTDIARFEHFEYGYTASSEQYLLEFAKQYPGLLGEVTHNIYLTSLKERTVILALVNAIASLDYESVRPFGQSLALMALTNPDVEIKEAAIRAYETWGHPEGANILSGADCPIGWLDKYRRQVIEDLGGVA